MLGRGEYAARYGPTTGDLVRLADTDLWVKVEADDVYPGDELLGGCGKTARDGVLVAARAGSGPGGSGRMSALDLIITNVLVLDPLLGVRRTSIGVAGAVLDDAALRAALPAGVGYLPVENARGLTRTDMIRNARAARVAVPVHPGPVTVDGVPVPVYEAASLPLTRLHHLG